MATFQVSKAFGLDLKSVLESQGINTKDLVLREQQLDNPWNIASDFKNADFVEAAYGNIEINGDALLNAAASLIKTGISVGSALAGVATCNVM